MIHPISPPSRRASRGHARAATIAVLVAGLGGLVIAFAAASFGSRPATSLLGASPTAASAFSDLPLVAVAQTPSPRIAEGPTDSGASPDAQASPPEQGIRADRIRIGRLSIDLAIVEGDGIEAPIGKAAHYPGSAWPGGGSNIYIYGHARTGMFINLWQARAGDTIELDLVDGTMRTYVVTQVLPRVPWDAVGYLGPTTSEQLTLQTSTSYFATAPRFVVIAVPGP